MITSSALCRPSGNPASLEASSQLHLGVRDPRTVATSSTCECTQGVKNWTSGGGGGGCEGLPTVQIL